MAVELFDDAQVTLVVMLAVDPSVYVPVAVNCTDARIEIVELCGVTSIETSVGAVTVKELAVLDTLPSEAEMLDDPTPTPVASPRLPTVAMDVELLDQVTELVIFAVVPSV
jgi:hypothetical protein